MQQAKEAIGKPESAPSIVPRGAENSRGGGQTVKVKEEKVCVRQMCNNEKLPYRSLLLPKHDDSISVTKSK